MTRRRSSTTARGTDSPTVPGPPALGFLRALARNNRREWFEEHRDRYERDLLHPLRELVDDMDARLARIAPEFVGDRRRSIFRIHRDVRFSKDKRPYKTNAACWFFHRDAGRTKGLHDSVAAAGFYFHLQPGQCFVGGGLWMPPAPALRRIREALVDDGDTFAATLRTPAFRRLLAKLDEDPGTLLTRLPRGFSDDTPGAAWLRFKSFTATHPLSDADATSPRVLDRIEKVCTAALPMVRWLNKALGYQPAERR